MRTDDGSDCTGSQCNGCYTITYHNTYSTLEREVMRGLEKLECPCLLLLKMRTIWSIQRDDLAPFDAPFQGHLEKKKFKVRRLIWLRTLSKT